MSYAKFWTPVGVAAALACAASAESDRNTLQHHEIKVEKELLIRATEVVDSPRADNPGAWSFGHLFEQAYGESARYEVAAIPSAEMEVRARVLKELRNQDLDQYQVAEILSDS